MLVQVVAFNLDTYAKYRLDEAPDAATLKAFAEGIVSGVVKPHYKSEEVCFPSFSSGWTRLPAHSAPT